MQGKSSILLSSSKLTRFKKRFGQHFRDAKISNESLFYNQSKTQFITYHKDLNIIHTEYATSLPKSMNVAAKQKI